LLISSFVAIDNVACGPAIDGVRMASDVSIEEAFRLARAMTLENAGGRFATWRRQIGDFC
jgi:glutamate dehydrogenase (NAD(P)+)